MARVLSKIPAGKIKPLRVSQKQKLTQQKIGKETARKAANAAQYEKEKAARATTGSRYGYDTMGGNTSSTYTNTRARTFREFIEIAESVSASDVKLAQSGRISRNADALQREIDAVKGGKKPATPTRSARRVTRQDFVDRSNVRVRKEENELDEKFTLAADKSKAQSPTPTKLPLTRERNIGKHDDWKDKPSTEWDDTPPAAKKLRSRANAVVGTQRRQDKETGVTEETAVADKPATKEEKRKIALMQKLARLHAAAKGSKMVSDVAKEEYEIDEAKVDAGLSDTEKKEVRTARSGLTGQYANNERRGAHREKDELNKDAKDIRKGKLGGPQFQGKTGAERIAQVKKAKGM